MVGKDPDDTLKFMQEEHFGAGYDVIIYNMCFPSDMDVHRIDNIMSQTRDLGIPAVLVHCAAHSFRGTSQHGTPNAHNLEEAHRQWSQDRPDAHFPYWWHFTGIDTTGHDWPRSVHAERMDSTHPITKWLPETIVSWKDELYQNLAVRDGVVPLYQVYSQQSKKNHIVAWTHEVGAGQVFATTLGHDENTLELSSFQQLIANGIGYITGKIDADGFTKPGYTGTVNVDNYQGTTTCNPGDVIDASNIAEIQKAIKDANRFDRSLKVVSLKKSNSNSGFICPKQGGILLNLWQMDRVLDLDEDAMTVTVEPGIRAKDLSAYLHEQGYAIRTMPDYTAVSIAGGTATAAHHSSLQIPGSMADMVVAMKIVDGQGQLNTFEGRDVAKAAAHMGMLGVVVEITLTIEPQFKLQYGFKKGRDDNLENQIEAMVREHPYARVMWFAGNGRYVMDYYDRVANDTPGESQHNLWTSSGSVFRIVGDIPYTILNRAPLRAQCDSALIRSRIWLPPFNAKNSDSSRPVGWSHQMLASDCSAGRCPWDNPKVQSRTMEAAFPLRRLKEWMTDVRAIIAENRACFPILGIYLRFSKASDRWMGFNYGEDVVAFEIHVPKVANETYYERSAAVYDEIQQMTLKKYGGRPHWGKNSTPVFVGLGPEQYPQWNAFMDLKRTMDPNGLFDNKIWKQMTGSARVEPYPACVLSRDCVCSQDSHCGDGFSCVEGGHYKAARVCR